MNVAIIGGTGFVGGYIVRDLAREGHQIVVFDLAPNRDYLGDVLSPDELERVRIVPGDVTDLPLLMRTMTDAPPDRIIHLAATLGFSSEANPLRSLRVNCEGTINIFEAALTFKASKVVWASSIAVFGAARRREPGEVANNAYHPCSGYGGRFPPRTHRQTSCRTSR